MITELYQKELRALKDKAKEFSKKYPAFAGHLDGESSDPDVERILEGVAFLGAGIQEKLDSGFPQFAQSLMNLLAPQYLQEIPATTIIEFKPKLILKTGTSVPSGTHIDSVETSGVSCRFSTTSDVDVYPIELKDVELNTLGDQKAILKLSFSRLGASGGEIDLTKLKFLVSGDYLDATTLFYLINTRSKNISLRQGGSSKVIAGCKIKEMGTDDEFELLDHPGRVLPCYRVLSEYFLNKNKFLYFQLDSKTGPILASDSSFDLEIELEQLRGRIPKVNTDSIRIFTTPAINLFEHESEPLKYDQHDSEVLIQPLRNNLQQYSVHSIDSVSGYNRLTATRREYFPMSLLASSDNETGVYEAVRKSDAETKEVGVYLSLSYPEELDIPQSETLSVTMKCSNGALANNLSAGEISKATSATSELLTFKNIAPPTTYVPAQTGEEVWNLLSHLTTNFLPIADLANLKSLLELYIPRNTTGKRDENANSKRLDSISDVEVEPVEYLFRGTMVRGQKIVLQIDGAGFAGLGDLYVFGTVVHKLFKDFAAINSFVELVVVDTNSGEELEWKAKFGSHSLI